VFSSRLQWHEASNPLTQLLAKKRTDSVRIFDLTESNPTRAALPFANEQILAALSDPRAFVYEPSPNGRTDARQAISGYYIGHGADVDISRILLTASTSEAYSYLFQLLADPGDEILSPQPSYPLFEFLAGLSSVKIRQYPLRYDGGWHVDFAALRKMITSRTKAIVVVNPNNPTGSFLKRDELEELESLAVENNLAIISDEVFCDYPFDSLDREQIVATLAGARRARTFSMSGLSKVAGLPQLKLGWIIASGPDTDASIEALELIADTHLSVGTPVQVALPKLLELSAALRAAIRERTLVNRDHLADAVAGSAATMLKIEGGWYAVLQVPNTRTAEEWALMLLAEADVLVQPGFFFDFESEAFLVLSLLTAPEVFREGVRCLRTFL
jgi:hypothetical protein